MIDQIAIVDSESLILSVLPGTSGTSSAQDCEVTTMICEGTYLKNVYFFIELKSFLFYCIYFIFRNSRNSNCEVCCLCGTSHGGWHHCLWLWWYMWPMVSQRVFGCWWQSSGRHVINVWNWVAMSYLLCKFRADMCCLYSKRICCGPGSKVWGWVGQL